MFTSVNRSAGGQKRNHAPLPARSIKIRALPKSQMSGTQLKNVPKKGTSLRSGARTYANSVLQRDIQSLNSFTKLRLLCFQSACIFSFKIKRFGDWILSPNSAKNLLTLASPYPGHQLASTAEITSANIFSRLRIS